MASLLPLNICVLMVLCSLTRMSLKWLVALKENGKSREKGKGFLSQTGIPERAGPGYLGGRSMDMEGFFCCRSVVPKGATFPEIHVAPTPHLACYSSVASCEDSLRLSTILSINGQPLRPPERPRNKDQSSTNIQALDAPVVLFF